MMHMMSVCEKRKLTKISLQNFIILQKEPPQPLCKRGVLKHFAIFIEKNLCWSLFSGLPVCNFLKKRLLFSCEYCKIFKNNYFKGNL